MVLAIYLLSIIPGYFAGVALRNAVLPEYRFSKEISPIGLIIAVSPAVNTVAGLIWLIGKVVFRK